MQQTGAQLAPYHGWSAGLVHGACCSRATGGLVPRLRRGRPPAHRPARPHGSPDRRGARDRLRSMHIAAGHQKPRPVLDDPPDPVDEVDKVRPTVIAQPPPGDPRAAGQSRWQEGGVLQELLENKTIPLFRVRRTRRSDAASAWHPAPSQAYIMGAEEAHCAEVIEHALPAHHGSGQQCRAVAGFLLPTSSASRRSAGRRASRAASR